MHMEWSRPSTHLTLQTSWCDCEVHQRYPRTQVWGEPGCRVSRHQKEEEVGAVIDVLRAESDESTAAGALQLAVQQGVKHRVYRFHILKTRP